MKQSYIKDRRQIGRFAAVGVINTVIDFILLFLLKSIGFPIITANLISTTSAFIFSFAVNRSYTFKSHNGDVARQATLFIIVTLIGLWGFQNIIIYFTETPLTNLLNNDQFGLFFSKVIATIISLIWNYIMYATVVFPPAPPK